MIIAGAGGHAREIFGVLEDVGIPGEIFFFDDLPANSSAQVWDQYTILHSLEEAAAVLKKDSTFILGVGNPFVRKSLFDKLTGAGGECSSIISPYARIGNQNVLLGSGLNIMTGAVITEDISIGIGTLIHINATVHHDCQIGEFCEISPGANVLGRVTIGDFVSVGAGAVILPGVTIASRAVVGAGAVVTRNVKEGAVVKGIPAR